MAIKIILNTSLLNALTLFTTVNDNKMSVTEFRKNIINVFNKNNKKNKK